MIGKELKLSFCDFVYIFYYFVPPFLYIFFCLSLIFLVACFQFLLIFLCISHMCVYDIHTLFVLTIAIIQRVLKAESIISNFQLKFCPKQKFFLLYNHSYIAYEKLFLRIYTKNTDLYFHFICFSL